MPDPRFLKVLVICAMAFAAALALIREVVKLDPGTTRVESARYARSAFRAAPTQLDFVPRDDAARIQRFSARVKALKPIEARGAIEESPRHEQATSGRGDLAVAMVGVSEGLRGGVVSGFEVRGADRVERLPDSGRRAEPWLTLLRDDNCFDGSEQDVTATIDVQENGAVSAVAVSGVRDEVQRCLSRRIERLRFAMDTEPRSITVYWTRS
jgi:hypothetical protein